MACLTGCGRHEPASESTLIVFAAASVADSVEATCQEFTNRYDIKVRVNRAASSTLAKQIISGAPADLFFSANSQWMDRLEQENLIDPKSRIDLIANKLVIVRRVSVDQGHSPPAAMTDIQLLLKRPFERIAIGDWEHVPAGMYAQQALNKLGLWDQVNAQLVPCMDVRAALRLVEIGEADLGIVYLSDAKQSSKVTVISHIPDDTHDPIRYPVGICRNASEKAKTLKWWLQTETALKTYANHGFTLLTKPLPAP